MKKGKSKNSRKSKKKIKTLKNKRKIRIVSSNKKDVKKIKEKEKKKPEIFEEGEFETMEFSEGPRSSPVLEKIAIQRNTGVLEQEIALASAQARQEKQEEEGEVKYTEAAGGESQKYIHEGKPGSESFDYSPTQKNKTGAQTLGEEELDKRSQNRGNEGLVSGEENDFSAPLGDVRRNRERDTGLREVGESQALDYKEYDSSKDYVG